MKREMDTFSLNQYQYAAQNVDAATRLGRAKSQYQNLLLNAKDIAEFCKTPQRSTPSRSMTNIPPPLPYGHDTFNDTELVESLQSEIDRLKAKLNTVIEAAENTCEEFRQNEVKIIRIGHYKSVKWL